MDIDPDSYSRSDQVFENSKLYKVRPKNTGISSELQFFSQTIGMRLFKT